MLSGWTVWAAVNLFRGFSLTTLPLVVLFALMGMVQGTQLFPFVAGCSLLGLMSPALIPWAMLVPGLLACSAGKTAQIRITGFIAVASTLWFIPVSASIPVVVVAATAALTGWKKLRYLVIPVGFVISALLYDLPGPLEVKSAVAGSEINNGIITYSIPEVNSSKREVLLPAPFEGRWAVWLALESGGVRDSLPMLAVRLGDDMLILPSGRDTLSFVMVPGDTLAITLMRNFRSFNHSVIHAAAGGERL